MDKSISILEDNLKLIESSNGCFICTICACQSFTDPTLFEAHLNRYHKSAIKIKCVYCNLNTSPNLITNHIIKHLRVSTSTSSLKQNIYCCPYQPKCSYHFETNHLQQLKLHWIVNHRISESTLRCHVCLTSLPNFFNWFEHIKTYSSSLVHCSASGCFVKSTSRELVLDHVFRKHSNNEKVPNIMKETIDMTCIDQSDLNDTGNNAELSSNIIGDNLLLINQLFQPRFNQSQQNGHLLPTLPIVFVLRCSHCDFMTVLLDCFLTHLSECSVKWRNSSNPSLPLLYWCSQCRALSTEENLIREHVSHAHQSMAVVYKETLDNFIMAYTSINNTTNNNNNNNDNNNNTNPESIDLNSLLFLVNQKLNSVDFEPNRNPLLSLPFIPLQPITDATSHTNLGQLNNNVHLINNNNNIGSMTASEAASAMAALTAAALSQFNLSNVPSNLSIPFPSLTDCNQDSINIKDSAITPTMNQGQIDLSSQMNGQHISDETTQTDCCSDTEKRLFKPATLENNTVHTCVTPTVPTTNAMPILVNNDDENVNSAGISETESPGSSRSSSKSNSDRSIHSYSKNNISNNGAEFSFSIPFDEVRFRTKLSTVISSTMLDNLVNKMQQFSSYLIRSTNQISIDGLTGDDDNRNNNTHPTNRSFVCPECNKTFSCNLNNLKKHLLIKHLELPSEHLKSCLKFTYLPKIEEKFEEHQEQIAMRQMKPHYLEPGRRRIPLPYSISILRKLTGHLSDHVKEFIGKKMQLYSRLSVIVDTRGDFRRYNCNHCSYVSPHALADVRKHILGSHCGISTKHFRHCLQASRLDPVEFLLFSDEKLARLAKRSIQPLSPSTPNHPQTDPDQSLSILNSNGIKHTTYSDNFNGISDNEFSNGDLNHSTDSLNHVPDTPCSNIVSTNRATESSVLSSPIAQTIPILESETQIGSSHQTAISKSNLLSLPSLPGIEGADCIVELPLPFSEPVLRQLLESFSAPKQIVEDIVSKMHIYSTYSMSRICQRDRTIAFRCPCGRLFVTARQPDSKIRPATLADSRRHVMGVHARIPNAFITICCQASRITKECDFQLYPDEMLLRLALDKPIKFNNLFFNAKNESSVKSTKVNNRDNTDLSLNELPRKSSKVIIASGCGSTSSGSSSSSSSSSSCASNSSHPEPSVINNSHNDLDSISEPEVNVSLSCGLGKSMSSEDQEQQLFNVGSKKFQTESEDCLVVLKATQASGMDEVERIIDLPYSSEALYTLVQSYCPDNYFPILESKMNIYSALKVFVCRRKGRRCFCCSACPSASPHGMGDIRKHILGVHAKVPERYKAAAMHCSRLSREDNSILPDHVLLHLAKMKWKGTVIKPPNQDSNRSKVSVKQSKPATTSATSPSSVAVVPNLPRSTSQFASQVYQPSVTHINSDENKLISTSYTTSPINDNPLSTIDISFANSTPTEVTPVSYETDVNCNHKFYVIRKVQPNHDSSDYQYCCSACCYTSNCVDNLKMHIVHSHIGLTEHKCAECAQGFQVYQDLLNHYELAHPGFSMSNEHQTDDFHDIASRISICDESEMYSNDDMPDESNLKSENNLKRKSHLVASLTGPQSSKLIRLTEHNNETGNEQIRSDSINLTINNDIMHVNGNGDMAFHDDEDDDAGDGKTETVNEFETRNIVSDVNQSITWNSPAVIEQSKKSVSIGSSRRKPNKLNLIQLRPMQHQFEPEISSNKAIIVVNSLKAFSDE